MVRSIYTKEENFYQYFLYFFRSSFDFLFAFRKSFALTSFKIFNFQKRTNIFTLDNTVSLYDRYALLWCSNNVGLEKHSLNLNIEEMSSYFEAYFEEKNSLFSFLHPCASSPLHPICLYLPNIFSIR